MASSLIKNGSNRPHPQDPRPIPTRLAEEAVSAVIEHDEKANILLVDDREDKRLAMETVIGDLGQNIVMATSGREALRQLLKQTFAVILLDVNMPGMDGFETAYLIRQRKSSENVPIIFVSAISDAENHVSRGYSLGAVDYILAPIVPEILRAKVAVFVELFKINDQVKRQTEDLRVAHRDLEKRVAERTQELAVANKSLQNEIRERQKVEARLRDLNIDLEHRVEDRTSALSAANKELETFSYSIAHDLRAPFRQIHGYAEILQEDFSQLLPQEAKNYLSRIGAKSKEMEQMVDDLLRLFVVAKQSVEFEMTDLTVVIEEVVATLKRESINRSIQWSVNTLPTVLCNRLLIRQVFENLVLNAIKYTYPCDLARIEIGYKLIDDEYIIYVQDNGVGFDMEQVERLFGVFQRLHRADEFEGTGVGLALASRIITKHGGRIWAKGEVGQGATFYFSLRKGGNVQK